MDGKILLQLFVALFPCAIKLFHDKTLIHTFANITIVHLSDESNMGILNTFRPAKDIVVGIWELQEGSAELLEGIRLNQQESDIFSNLKTEQRRRHWLSYRCLLQKIIGEKDYSHVNYDSFGKPYLINSSNFLSVAHSGKFATAILSKLSPVGIDIEKISDKVERVSHKFMSKEENDNCKGALRNEMLFVHWCAKEALYKLYGEKELIFDKNICIEAFKYPGNGTFAGHIHIEGQQNKYILNHIKIDDYMLVYAF